jgi:subtilisin family serine protease
MEKNSKIALLDTGIDLSHPVFGGVDMPQFAYHDKGLERSDYKPKQGHGTAVASILAKNSAHCAISSFVLFEDALSKWRCRAGPCQPVYRGSLGNFRLKRTF